MGVSTTIGIVIDSIDIGEADKIITIFTQRYGKIEAVIKGAQRPKSGLLAASQFLALSNFMLYKSEMYKVNSAELIETFYPIRQDMNKLVYASYITEILRFVLNENERNYKLLQLYLNALFCISETDKDFELIARIFEIKVLCLIGYRPKIDNCLENNDHSDLFYFSFKENGVIGEKCLVNDDSAIKILTSTAKVINYIIKSNIKQVFSIKVHESVLNELKIINKVYMENKLEKEFKTLELFKNTF